MESNNKYETRLIKRLKENPKFRDAYLNEALKDPEEDPRVVLDMLRHVAEATGGFTHLSRVTHLNRGGLYKSLSRNGNPEFTTVNKIVQGLGYSFQIVRKEKQLADRGAH